MFVMFGSDVAVDVVMIVAIVMFGSSNVGDDSGDCDVDVDVVTW